MRVRITIILIFWNVFYYYGGAQTRLVLQSGTTFSKIQVDPFDNNENPSEIFDTYYFVGSGIQYEVNPVWKFSLIGQYMVRGGSLHLSFRQHKESFRYEFFDFQLNAEHKLVDNLFVYGGPFYSRMIRFSHKVTVMDFIREKVPELMQANQFGAILGIKTYFLPFSINAEWCHFITKIVNEDAEMGAFQGTYAEKLKSINIGIGFYF